MFLFYFGSQIDDKEFDIPQVDTPPTLESILNEVKYMFFLKVTLSSFEKLLHFLNILYIYIHTQC